MLIHLFLSIVPWWVFALLGIGVVIAVRLYLGKTLATYAAVTAILIVGADAIGDARERWVRAEWAEASRRAEITARARDAAAAKEAEAAAQAHAAAEDAADQKIEEVIHAARQDAEARASAARRLSADDIARLRAIDRHAGP